MVMIKSSCVCYHSVMIKSLDFGEPGLTSGASGVVLSDSGVAMSLTADWSYEEKSW